MKVTITSRPGGERKFLVELGHVPVMADAVGVEAFRHFREQHFLLRRPARSGHARFGVDDDLVGIDRLASQQRDERKLGAARVAARIGDELRRLDLRRDRFRSARKRLSSATPARHAHARTSARKRPDRQGGNRPRDRRPSSPATRSSRSAMTSCVVPCGSAQKTRSSAERRPIDLVERRAASAGYTARIAETHRPSACRRGGRP